MYIQTLDAATTVHSRLQCGAASRR